MSWIYIINHFTKIFKTITFVKSKSFSFIISVSILFSDSVSFSRLFTLNAFASSLESRTVSVIEFSELVTGIVWSENVPFSLVVDLRACFVEAKLIVGVSVVADVVGVDIFGLKVGTVSLFSILFPSGP